MSKLFTYGVEVHLGVLGWVDITEDVRGAVTITRGHTSEGNQADPGRCSLRLDNRSGDYSPRNPAGQWYGYLGRNTPLRVTRAGPLVTEDFEDTSYAVSISGTWARDNSRSQSGSWSFRSANIGDDQTSDAVVTVPAGATSMSLWWWTDSEEDFDYLHVLLDGDEFFVASGQSVSWAQETFDVTGISTVTFRYVKDGSASDGADAVWIDSLTFGSTRFYGEVPAWPPSWSLDGADRYVDVEAAGILRRLGQGTAPAKSALRRTIEASGPLLYWPVEDGVASGQVASAIGGHPPLALDASTEFKAVEDFQDPFDTIRFGTSALADLSTGGVMSQTAPLPATIETATATGWTVCVAGGGFDPANISGDVDLLEWDTPGGTYVKWRLRYLSSTTRVQVLGYDSAGTQLLLLEKIGVNLDFGQRMVSAYPSGGGGVTIDLNETASDVPDETATYAATLGGISGGIRVNRSGATSTEPMPVGHIAVWATNAPPPQLISADDSYGQLVYSAWASWFNETATDRMARLCAEENVPLSLETVDADSVQRMGWQPVGTFGKLLDESVQADGGYLYESRDALGLTYRHRTSLYNQTPVSIAYTGQLSPPFEPVDDADSVRNDVTVSRTNGSSARVVKETGPLAAVVPPDGVGVYQTSVELNLADDTALADIAGWQVHLGTVDEPRYPALSVQLAAPGWQADPAGIAALLGVDTGDVLDVTGVPEWAAGEVRTLATGYTEVISEYLWLITFAGAPASPWDVAEADGDPRVAADGSTVGVAIGSTTSTSFEFTFTAENGAWVTGDTVSNPTDFPMLVRVGSEVVEVSGISRTTSPQLAAVSARGVNGVRRAWPVGTPVDVAEPAIVGL
ncbi:hypothetical protein F8280_12135 [Micromonospora noduli]|uniref:hypothetical protein n=1 Tax=Micromonospora noduli TaxID=709876 RepID=UPI00124BACDC|nr:hypothetical protein [Micromonospora noduli]KAB1925152.1 hypothetical protein F8280_12135 [Micromonospora noduli]